MIVSTLPSVPKPRSRQTSVFLAGVLLMIAVQAMYAPGLWGQVLILAPAVALLGLPHGALDLPMAQTLWPLRNLRDRTVFFASYIGLAVAVGGLWWMAPGVALAAFLAYSALHFSGDWQADGVLWRLSGGLSAVGAPAVFHLSDVTAIFAILGPTDWAATIAQGTAAVGLLGAASAIAAIITGWRWPQRMPLLEVVAIWVGAAFLPPLLSFVVYFCLLHSFRHLTDTLAVLPDRMKARRGATGIMLVTLVGAAVVLALLIGGAGIDLETSLLRVVFIGLAALTVPHMVLVEMFSKSGAVTALQGA